MWSLKGEKNMKQLGKKRNGMSLSVETFSCGCTGCYTCHIPCGEVSDTAIEQEYADGRHIYNMDILSAIKQK
jgi:putative bacteriocin precursor